MTKEPYYTETLLPLSYKISENVDIFTNRDTLWNGVFSKYSSNASIVDLFDYTALQNNIENELLNKNIISTNINNAYYLLPLNDGTLQSDISPINSTTSFDGDNSMYYRLKLFYKVTNPSNTFSSDAIYGNIYIKNNTNLEIKNLVKSYINSFYKGNISVGNNTDSLFKNNDVNEFLNNSEIFE